MSCFAKVENIEYEGPTSKNPLAFKFYNPEEKIGDKTMEEFLRFGVAYWHTFTEDLSDPLNEIKKARGIDEKNISKI